MILCVWNLIPDMKSVPYGRSYDRISGGGNNLSKTLSFVVIFVMLICSNSVWGQIFSYDDTLSIPSGIGDPGDTILVPIDLLNTFMVLLLSMKIQRRMITN